MVVQFVTPLQVLQLLTPICDSCDGITIGASITGIYYLVTPLQVFSTIGDSITEIKGVPS